MTWDMALLALCGGVGGFVGTHLYYRIKGRVSDNRFTRVDNMNRRFGADTGYWYIRAQDSVNTSIQPFLFTTDELNTARLRAARNQEDLPR